MLGMKNHFDISGSIEIREVDIAGVACIYHNTIIMDSGKVTASLFVLYITKTDLYSSN